MFEIFLSVLIIQMLIGFTFRYYFLIPLPWQSTNDAYSFQFNMILAAIIALLVVMLLYIMRNHKNTLQNMSAAVKNFFKYSIIINVIEILLAQLFLININQAYLHFHPKPEPIPYSQIIGDQLEHYTNMTCPVCKKNKVAIYRNETDGKFLKCTDPTCSFESNFTRDADDNIILIEKDDKSRKNK